MRLRGASKAIGNELTPGGTPLLPQSILLFLLAVKFFTMVPTNVANERHFFASRNPEKAREIKFLSP